MTPCTPTRPDAELDALVVAQIGRTRFRRAMFALLSLVVIVAEIGLAVALLVVSVRDDDAASGAIVYFSAASTLVLTMDASLGIRERAASNHAKLNQLLGIRLQLQNPGTSHLWAEYADAMAHSRVNLVEAVLDTCACQVVAEDGTSQDAIVPATTRV